MRGGGHSVVAPVFADVMDRGRLRRECALFVACVAGLCYANALQNGFVLDDGGIILRNTLVTSPTTAWRAFGLPYWPDAIGGGQYRPLGIISLALDWLLSGGDATWFHAVNVLWHVAATLAVWALAAELLAPMAALVAALLFAVHPVHVEAVANVVGRLESMSAVFVILALLAHRRGLWMSALWFAAGLLSKEIAIAFIALAVAHDLLLQPDPRAAFRSRRWLYAGYGAIIVAFVAAIAVVFHDRPFVIPSRTFNYASTAERLLTVATVVPHYVRLLVVPIELSASYEPAVISLSTTLTVAGALGIAITLGFTGLIVLAWRRSRVLAFALLWIPVTLAPVANVFFASGVTLAERNLYVPSVGVCIAAGWLAQNAGLGRPTMAMALASSVALGFGVRSWMRTPAWRDDATYVMTLLREHPESYHGHLTAGRVLKGAHDYNGAAGELAIARRIFARDPAVYREAAEVAAAMGRPNDSAVLLDSANAIARTNKR